MNTNRTMLRAKIHRVTVTECDLEYEGSLTLDPLLMEAADMLPFERIEVYDVTNGNRFATYLIEGRRGGGECCLNGAAAHMVEIGDKVILATYATLTDAEAAAHRPRVVVVGEANTVAQVKHTEGAAVRV